MADTRKYAFRDRGIIALLKQGLKRTAIAEAMGVSKDIVSGVRHRAILRGEFEHTGDMPRCLARKSSQRKRLQAIRKQARKPSFKTLVEYGLTEKEAAEALAPIEITSPPPPRSATPTVVKPLGPQRYVSIFDRVADPLRSPAREQKHGE